MTDSVKETSFCSHLIALSVKPKLRGSIFGVGRIQSAHPTGFLGVFDRTDIVLVILLDSNGVTIVDGADNWVTA